MKKIILAISSLLLSSSIVAATLPQNLNSAILNVTKKQANVKVITTSSMIYGGQDISRAKIATADESLWAGQRTLIG